MKYRLLGIFLAALMLTSCGQNASNDNLTETSSLAQESVSDSTEAESGSDFSQSEEAEPFVLTFEASTIDGDVVTSDIFANSKLTMLNVWGTFCNPCLNEMPDLGEIAASYDTSVFQMYGIISDVVEGDEPEKLEEARDLITQTRADYPHLL